MDLGWETVGTLADYKRAPPSNYKVELWVLLSSAGLMRVLSKDLNKLADEDEQRATWVYGSERWTAIQALRLDDEITPSEAREEFVNLYRWQLERDLGYRWTHALEIKNLRGVPLYHMVFATDHSAGHNIMTWLYNRAAERLPEMQREARDRIGGQLAFELDGGRREPLDLYRHEPPWEPPS